jgi:hypothetical protein
VVAGGGSLSTEYCNTASGLSGNAFILAYVLPRRKPLLSVFSSSPLACQDDGKAGTQLPIFLPVAEPLGDSPRSQGFFSFRPPFNPKSPFV